MYVKWPIFVRKGVMILVTIHLDSSGQGLVKKDPFIRTSSIVFEMVAILDLSVQNRGLSILHSSSRSFQRDSVAEFLVTSEEVELGGKVNSVSYLGFGAAMNSGQAVVGRKVLVRGRQIGYIGGFDETHAPNHINVVLVVEEAISGLGVGLQLGDLVTIERS